MGLAELGRYYASRLGESSLDPLGEHPAQSRGTVRLEKVVGNAKDGLFRAELECVGTLHITKPDDMGHKTGPPVVAGEF
jgi:hypothetical protein